MLIALFNGLGNAQNSGTMETWLDNNYKNVVEDTDSERKIYGFSRSRILTLTRIASAFAFMIGGSLATLVSREFVFGVQGFFSIFLIILVLLVVKDEKIDNIPSSDKQKKSAANGYFSHFFAGLKFLFSSKAPFFFILGTAFLFGSFAIWGNLILMPLYFGFSGSDSLASALRTLAFVTGVPISIYIAKLSQRFTKEKASILTFLFVILFYPSFILLTFLIPTNNEFNLIGCLASVIILSGLIPTLFDLGQILRQRIMIDMIPSETRNAVYSLIPTIISVLGIFIIPIAGILIEDFGLTAGITAAFLVAFVGSIMISIGIHFQFQETKAKTEIAVVQPETSATTGP
jgi:hypothetical protein